jgi:hypothetical protein
MSHHRMWTGRMSLGSLAIAACAFASLAQGHEHHTNMIADGQGVSEDPIVSHSLQLNRRRY